MIYNPYIGFNIPLSTYMVLETNRNLEFELKGKYNKFVHKNPNLVEYKKRTLISHKRRIVRNKKGIYLLNSSLLHYIRFISTDLSKSIMKEIDKNENISGAKVIIQGERLVLKV